MFIGDVGRPDLRASLGYSANELGGHLYDSLHNKLLPLPDETLVYPAHGAGSLCGKQLSSDTVSPLGIQRRLNYALQPMSKDEFIALVTADQPDAPQYFTYDAILNTRERGTLDKQSRKGPAASLARRSPQPAEVRRTTPRRPRRRRVRQRPSHRQPQHRPRRPVRHMGRHAARPRKAHRHPRRARPRARSRTPPRPHRLRPRARLPRQRPRRTRHTP